MKIIRYLNRKSVPQYGLIPASGIPQEAGGDPFSGLVNTGRAADIAQLLAPVVPAALICIGLNYRQHAAETHAPLPRYPVVFMKNPAALQHPEGEILIPRWMPSSKVDYEAELAVVISKPCKNVRSAEALDYVLGYTCANDVSARDWQKEGGGTQWCRGKSFDTFAPLGPCLVTPDDLPDPSVVRLRTWVDDELRQDCGASDMIFSVPQLIEFLSGSSTLLPGTVILTGTPHGVGMAMTPPQFLRPGQTVTVEIDKIGALKNSVALESAAGTSSFRLEESAHTKSLS